MKILMLIDSLGLGGAEADLIRLATYLNRRHEVTIALFADLRTSPKMADLPPEVGIEILPAGSGRVERWRARSRRFSELAMRHDACVSFLTGANALAALTPKRCPVMISIRGSRIHDPIETLGAWVLAKLVDPVVYRKAEAIHSCSAGITYEMRDFPAAVRDKIATIEGTVNVDDLLARAAEPVEDFTPSDRPTVMVCGRLHPHKGIDRIIDFFAGASRRLPRAQLVVIGDGPDRDSLLQKCEQTGLKAAWDAQGSATEADVRFLGQRRTPHRFFRFAQLFAMPSRTEGLPNMLIEALASGVPIISADFPWGARQLLSGGTMESGFEHPVAEPQQLAFGELLPQVDDPRSLPIWVDRLVDHLREPRRFLTPPEVEQAIRRFDLEQTGPRWEEVLEQIAARRQAGMS